MYRLYCFNLYSLYIYGCLLILKSGCISGLEDQVKYVWFSYSRDSFLAKGGVNWVYLFGQECFIIVLPFSYWLNYSFNVKIWRKKHMGHNDRYDIIHVRHSLHCSFIYLFFLSSRETIKDIFKCASHIVLFSSYIRGVCYLSKNI